MSTNIWNIIVTLVNAALLTSIALTRWKKVISIIIERRKKNSKINQLRIIDKFEADYNLILKLYSPKIINQIADANGTLRKNQIGTCKSKSATDTVLIKECII